MTGNGLSIDLPTELHMAHVDHAELLDVLVGHFGSAGGPSGTTYYPSAEAPRLVVNAVGNRIASIKPGQAFDPGEVPAMRERVEAALLRDQESIVTAAIAFAARPVRGSYGAPDATFQILPAPETAPRPPFVYGDHPFVVQLRIPNSKQGAVLYDGAAERSRSGCGS